MVRKTRIFFGNFAVKRDDGTMDLCGFTDFCRLIMDFWRVAMDSWEVFKDGLV